MPHPSDHPDETPIRSDEARAKPWTLAIDFGSTSTVVVAADPAPTVVEVDGERSMPSFVFVDEDDSIVVGSPAVHLAGTRPERAIRSPKRRLADRSPIVVGGQGHSPVSLAGAVIARAADEAIRQAGRPPSEVRLTFPAMWGAAARERLVEAAQEAGLSSVSLVPEPVAAAASLGDSTPIGSAVAVYDLGGGTFDTALVERTTNGFRVVGRSAGTDDVGGELLDEAIRAAIGERLEPATWERIQVAETSEWRQANMDLLDECRRVKEAVSSHPYGEIRVATPDGVILERVTRQQIEAIVGPHLGQTVELLGDVLAAGDGPLHGIHLVGGGSRMPLVRSLIEAAHPDVAIRSSGDPRVAAARGAALSPQPPASTTRETNGVPAADADLADDAPVPVDAGEVPDASGSSRRRLGFALVAALFVLVGGAAMVSAMIGPDSTETAADGSIRSEAASSADADGEAANDTGSGLGSERGPASSADDASEAGSEPDEPAASDPDSAEPTDALEPGSVEPNAATADALGPTVTVVGSTLDGAADYVVTTTDRASCPAGELRRRDASGTLGPSLADVSGNVELVDGPQGVLVVVERCNGDFVRLRSGSQFSGSLDASTLLEADIRPRPARLELLGFDFVRQILVGDALFADSAGVWQEVEVNLGDDGVRVVGPSPERPGIVLGSEGLAIVDQLSAATIEFLSFGAPSADVVDRVAELRAGAPELVAAAGCEGDYLVSPFDGITLTFLPDGRFAGWFLRPGSLAPALETANGVTLGTTIEELEVAGGRLLLNPAESGAGGFTLQIGDDATGTAGMLSGFSLDDEPSSTLIELGAGQNCAALVASD